MAVRISLSEAVSANFSRWLKILAAGMICAFVVRVVWLDLYGTKDDLKGWFAAGVVLLISLGIIRHLMVRALLVERTEELRSVQAEYDALWEKHIRLLDKQQQKVEKVIEREIRDQGPNWSWTTGPDKSLPLEEAERIRQEEDEKRRKEDYQEFKGFESYRSDNQHTTPSPTLSGRPPVGRMAYERWKKGRKGRG